MQHKLLTSNMRLPFLGTRLKASPDSQVLNLSSAFWGVNFPCPSDHSNLDIPHELVVIFNQTSGDNHTPMIIY